MKGWKLWQRVSIGCLGFVSLSFACFAATTIVGGTFRTVPAQAEAPVVLPPAWTNTPEPTKTPKPTRTPKPTEPSPTPFLTLPTEPSVAFEWATLVEVVDGDTVKVQYPGGPVESVRILGINTPEMNECGGPEARQVLADLLAGGPIILVGDSLADERDKYGRLLAYVEFEIAGERFDAGYLLVTRGWADSFKYDSSTGYPYEREPEYHSGQVPLPFTCALPTTPPILPTSPPNSSCEGRVFANCTEVRNAGCAPVKSTDSWYRSKFDRDGDGVGCE